jgi:hypothetical protein
MSAQQRSVRCGQHGLRDRLLANLDMKSGSVEQVMVYRPPKGLQIARDEKKKD